jgi:hypothetical protein
MRVRGSFGNSRQITQQENAVDNSQRIRKLETTVLCSTGVLLSLSNEPWEIQKMSHNGRVIQSV